MRKEVLNEIKFIQEIVAVFPIVICMAGKYRLENIILA